MDYEKLKITQSEEYKKYMKALCRIASGWVSKIRIQFARKAFEKYQDETLRRLVLACGEEIEKQDAYRLREFRSVSEREADDPIREDFLNDDCCLIYNHEYARAVFLLFDIEV